MEPRAMSTTTSTGSTPVGRSAYTLPGINADINLSPLSFRYTRTDERLDSPDRVGVPYDPSDSEVIDALLVEARLPRGDIHFDGDGMTFEGFAISSPIVVDGKSRTVDAGRAVDVELHSCGNAQ
eukprot:Opistho-2@69339